MRPLMVTIRLIICDGPEETTVGTWQVNDPPMVGDEIVTPGQFGYRKYLVKWRRINVDDGVLQLCDEARMIIITYSLGWSGQPAERWVADTVHITAFDATHSYTIMAIDGISQNGQLAAQMVLWFDGDAFLLEALERTKQPGAHTQVMAFAPEVVH